MQCLYDPVQLCVNMADTHDTHIPQTYKSLNHTQYISLVGIHQDLHKHP